MLCYIVNININIIFYRYGLIRLPKKDKNAKIAAPRASIFDSDSDEVYYLIFNK